MKGLNLNSSKDVKCQYYFAFYFLTIVQIIQNCMGLILNIYRFKSLLDNQLIISLMDYVFYISTSLTFMSEVVTRTMAIIVVIYTKKTKRTCLSGFFQVHFFSGLSFDILLLSGFFILYLSDSKPDFQIFIQEIIAIWTIFIAIGVMLFIGSNAFFFMIINSLTSQNKKKEIEDIEKYVFTGFREYEERQKFFMNY